MKRFTEATGEVIRTIREDYTGDRDPFDSLCIELTDWANVEPSEDVWFIPSDMTGSDYSGGTHTKSNHRVFMEDYPASDDIRYITHGTFGHYSVAIRLDRLVNDSDLRETLDSLADYPVLSEEDMGELEGELEDEAWNDYGRSDVIEEIAQALEIDPFDIPDSAEWIAAFDTVAYYVWSWGNGDDFIHEMGCTIYIRTDIIAENILSTLRDLRFPNPLQRPLFTL